MNALNQSNDSPTSGITNIFLKEHVLEVSVFLVKFMSYSSFRRSCEDPASPDIHVTHLYNGDFYANIECVLTGLVDQSIGRVQYIQWSYQ